VALFEVVVLDTDPDVEAELSLTAEDEGILDPSGDSKTVSMI
jgi:hypothetical protein